MTSDTYDPIEITSNTVHLASTDTKLSTVTPRSEFIDAIKTIFPILLGAFPFAMVTGVAAVNVGLPPIEALSMGIIVLAGASQLVSLQLFSAGAPLPVIIISALIVNLRFMMYSAAIAPYLKSESPRWKATIAYMLSDQAFGVAIAHFTSKPNLPHKKWYLFGACFSMWLTWQLGAALGVFIGAQLPSSWSLDFTIPLSFLAVMMPTIRDKASTSAAVTSAFVAILAYTLPFRLGLTTAALIGITVGVLVENYTERTKLDSPIYVAANKKDN